MPHRGIDLAARYPLPELAAEPFGFRPRLRIAAQHIKRDRLDQRERADRNAAGACERKRDDAAIGMGDDVNATGLVLDERLDQP
jgi:hypothetical protein